MPDVADRHRRLAAAFTERVDATPPDRWDAPSPCPDWTARAVVGHVAGNVGLFFGFVGLEVPSAPDVAEDPAGAWRVARDAMQAALDDPATAAREFEGGLGRQTLAQAVDRFVCTDLVIHAWDLARAVGADDRLDPEEVRRIEAAMAPLADRLRGPGAFGPAVEPPPDADEQDRLLAFLGRDPRWRP